MKNKINILFVCDDLNFIISHRLHILKKLLELNYNIIILYRIGSLKSLHDLEALNILCIESRLNNFKFTYLYYSLSDIRLLIRKHEIHIVHAITIKNSFFSLLAMRKYKSTPLVMSISGLGTLFIEKRLYLLRIITSSLFRALAKRNNKRFFIFQNSEDIRDLLGSEPAQYYHTIIRGSGVDLKLYDKQSYYPEVVNFVFAGRLTVQKGFRDFVDLAKKIQRRTKEVKFTVFGDIHPSNPSSITLNELNKHIGDGDIVYGGFRSDIENIFLNEVSCLILTSEREGFPKSVIDAAAAGKPSIVYNVAGSRDSVEHGVTGVIVEKSDTCMMQKVVLDFIENPGLIEKMGQSAKVKATKEFDISSVIRGHLTVYEEVI